jgi:hypothetical protein
MTKMPGAEFTVCTVEVLPFPHRNATGDTPFCDDAVHVMLVGDGTPTHDAVNADTALADTPTASMAIPSAVAICLLFCIRILLITL